MLVYRLLVIPFSLSARRMGYLASFRTWTETSCFLPIQSQPLVCDARMLSDIPHRTFVVEQIDCRKARSSGYGLRRDDVISLVFICTRSRTCS
jgi:hypothetical protein